MPKYVYFFGSGKAEGSSRLRELLGGKGSELAEMTNLGIPVPPGFTITTETWAEYRRDGRRPPAGLWPEVLDSLRKLEAVSGLILGDAKRPLLVSVRSGARVSMPGMMETVLNLGLNDATVEGLAAGTGNERFAWDCYRRFVTMFADVVLGIERRHFDQHLEGLKTRLRVRTDPEIPAGELRALVQTFKGIVAERTSAPFPQDPAEQLRLAINAVFDSWFAKKAVDYRRIQGIPEDWGTAVTVMAMVFGNLGDTSGTGVAFTRDPATGERRFYGEFLVNAQGEDVVAGIRTPEPISALRDRLPRVYDELVAIKDRLEKHYRDVQDLEFTVQEGTLYLLQSRSGKRTARAAVRVAVEMVREGLIDKDTALLRVEPDRLNELLHPICDPTDKARAIDKARLLAKGLPAGPRAAVGQVVFTPDRAVEWVKEGRKVILVRAETSPEDVAGMHAAEGILTSRGGLTSHAAVVARGMGKACIVGAGDVFVDEERHAFQAGRAIVREGDIITLDGHTGEVILDEVRLIPQRVSGELQVFLKWADEVRALGVRANADTPDDARKAREYGAEGIGLVRTEHMFFQAERIPTVREMIMAADGKARRAALDRLLPLQREDFIGIFRAMDGLPVTIRLLDPPLHEFLPQYTKLLEEYTRLDALGINPARAQELEQLMAKVRGLQEANPMLGHRGCRLGIMFPEIYEMQVRAIVEAACAVTREGVTVEPEIMIPLTGTVGEMKLTWEMTKAVADEVLAETGVAVKYLIGTMIEVPRAALIADQIAQHAEFFSFGTNDLTQMTFGYSRDDIGKFLPFYLERGLVPHDPFSVLDQEGVGELVRIGIERGRRVRPQLKVGICGEHGGEPSSVEFCHRVRMTYVSCSPFMIPIARLAAAQARLREGAASGGGLHG
ncbi:MAG TPA: pyruvate, phosphate dikinase [Methylomirabilota bacterium]|jgi:pyruvate,orthophosphate dikinase|nr:pyruvate, phosphate dikinase [Methylomirabilota bacterium]